MIIDLVVRKKKIVTLEKTYFNAENINSPKQCNKIFGIDCYFIFIALT